MALELKNLRKSYGDLTVLQDLSLTVRAGEIYGFVGANGAGKTTTMRIALGVLSRDGGTTTLNGADIDDTVRRTIGYMPEERGLYPNEKVADQLHYFAGLHGLSKQHAAENVDKLLEMLDLSHRRDDNLNALSLGNQQRVQLAASLVHDPAALILDEPFSGLDPIAVEVMATVLRQRAEQGVPVLFSSHQLELVERLCDRIGILRDGALIAEGTVAELRSGGNQVIALTVEGASDESSTPAWTANISGITQVEADPHNARRYLFTVAADAAPDTDQALLAAATKAGTVREFAPIAVPLTKLYQEVIHS